jgi:hypothetical protein
MRLAEAPNPYAEATPAFEPTPELDPRYDPYGQPPDGYLIALAAAKLMREEEE